MRRPTSLACLVICLVSLGLPAPAQDTQESRLREMLRRTTVELRSLQDSQAALKATADQATQQRDDLQKQVAALNDKLAQAAKAEQELVQLRGAAQELDDKNKELQSGLQRMQGAYQQAAAQARSKDAEGKTLAARAKDDEAKLAVCKTANGKLIGVANDILHLYQTQDFRSLLLGSYEPLLGLKKVELENTVQDYEDKIMDQQYFPNQPAAQARTGQ